VNTTVTSNLSYDQGIYDFALSYHLGARPIPYRPDISSEGKFPRLWFAPIAGAHLNDLGSSIETTFTFNNLERSRTTEVRAGRTWFEPMLGAEVGVQVSKPVTLWARGDASGFGLAGEEDLSYNAIFGVDWQVYPQVSLKLAYRFYSIKYGNDGFIFEQNFNGPLLGVEFSF
jgi:hypothetical protein